MKAIPYGRQHITQKDIDGVVEVLKSDFMTQGPRIAEFEKKFSEYIGCKYAVAVSNGTAALHLSVLALDLNPGEKVITTPITFAASANAVLYTGGVVDFVDIDPETFLLDLNKLEEKLSSASIGTYKGVIPVDFAGLPVDTERLRKIADKYNLWILEDACHAPGGYFTDTKENKIYCGDGNYADLSIFSFHPVKHIATGEGGMVSTNNKELYEKLLLLRTHGITKSEDLLTENHGGWYYEMQDLGYNYRLPDISASLGITQLENAKTGVARRNEIAKKYQEAFDANGIAYQYCPDNMHNAYHLFIILTEKRKELYDALRTNNIFSQVHYIPVHLQPYYKNLGWQKGDLPVAEAYYEQCLSLPMYPTLTNEEQDFVIEKIKEVLA